MLLGSMTMNEVTQTAARDGAAHKADGTADHDHELRDRHLFAAGPKRMLALDGGGVRGAITVAFLEQIEKILADEQDDIARQGGGSAQSPLPPHQSNGNKTVHLGDWFDLVGGTSTGAIMAGALALGYTIAEIKEFYLALAPRVFRRPPWRIPYLQAKFDARALSDEIHRIVKDRTLDSADLITGLAVITKRLDTGSPWILANNPRAPYWEDAPSHIGNKHYNLATLVRASTAAPHYFDPEILPINKDVADDPLGNVQANLTGFPILSFLLTKMRAYGLALRRDLKSEGYGLFVDGGVTPYNNPTMALLMMAVLKPFGMCWELGAKNLTIFSIGTGSYRTKVTFREVGLAGPLGLAIGALLSLMGDTKSLALAQMQWLGECLTYWPVNSKTRTWEINSEIKSLADEVPPGGHWFRFARYDLRLETRWLADNLGLKLTDKEVARFQRMDDPGIIKSIYAIARLAAAKQVQRAHFFPERG